MSEYCDPHVLHTAFIVTDTYITHMLTSVCYDICVYKGAASVQKGRHREPAALGLLDRMGQVRAATRQQRSEL